MSIEVANGLHFNDLVKATIREEYESNGTIIVLNWGAHYMKDDLLELIIMKTLTWFQNILPKSLIIHRSVNLNHRTCHMYSKPTNLNHPPVDEPAKPKWYVP